MHSARIAALLQPFLDRQLSSMQLDQISTYIDLLLRWNARINLTAVRNAEEIVPRHFGESLFLARQLFPDANIETEPARSQLAARGSKLVVDLGSGAGFPALPIKIWAPHIHLTMIESNHKKAAFLREAARALTLTNVDVIAERAESLLARLPKARPAKRPDPDADNAPSKVEFPLADVVTFRAVERFKQILPVATKFLASNARLAVLISAAQLAELESVPSITWQLIHVPQSYQRILAVGAIS